MRSTERTLVMSPPELWGLINQQERMQGLMSSLTGSATYIRVSECEPETKLAWESLGTDPPARIEVELAEKGWGTNVSLSADSNGDPTRLDNWLEAVLDELSTPEKRPFSGIV